MKEIVQNSRSGAIGTEFKCHNIRECIEQY